PEAPAARSASTAAPVGPAAPAAAGSARPVGPAAGSASPGAESPAAPVGPAASAEAVSESVVAPPAADWPAVSGADSAAAAAGGGRLERLHRGGRGGLLARGLRRGTLFFETLRQVGKRDDALRSRTLGDGQAASAGYPVTSLTTLVQPIPCSAPSPPSPLSP